MGDEYQPFKEGKTSFPLEVNPAVPAFARIDPHVDVILDYIMTCMRTHLLDAWDAEVVKPLVGNPALVDNLVHKTTHGYSLWPYNPMPHLTQVQAKLPALAMWWVGSEFAETSRSYDTETARYVLAYILPPIKAEQMVGLQPFVRGFVQVVKNRLIHAGHDQTWRADALVAREAGVDAIRLVRADAGYLDGDRIGARSPELLFYAASVELELDLANKPVYTEPGLLGLDTTISLASPPEDPVEVIETSQQFDPYP